MAALDLSDDKFNFLKDIYLSFVFLTRLPAPGWTDAASRTLSTGMWAFPIVGVLVATIAGLVFAVGDATGLPVYISALFALVAMIITTGGLHEDGLSDLADGAWGGADPAQRLEIMSDSRIGAYGAIALIVSLAGRTAAIATIAEPLFVLGALVASAAVSRAIMPAMMAFGKPAKSSGLGAGAGTPDGTTCCISLLVAAVIAAIAAPAGWLICLAAAIAAAVLIAWFARCNLGGYTGDVLGAGQQVAELLALTMIAGVIAEAG
ncbi:MAG: adenosylcobinamide-GDP ribazoletransferase [Rhodospirillaceae bacterium]|mgnify:CR=1 FL=1|nr:adenosylcobinamide-GDP ribazoletransferase [Rhodospirillaceae bacterium]